MSTLSALLSAGDRLVGDAPAVGEALPRGTTVLGGDDPVALIPSQRRAPRPRRGVAGDYAGYRASQRWRRQHLELLVGLDAAAIALAATLAFFLRFHDAGNWEPYLAFTLALPPAWVVAMALCRAYEARFLGAGYQEFRRVLNGAIRFTMLVAVVSYATRAEIARSYVLIALPLATVLSLLGRWAGRGILSRLRQNGKCRHNVLVVGNREDAERLTLLAERNPWAGWDVVGACLDRRPRRGDRTLRETTHPAGRDSALREWTSGEDEADTQEVPILSAFDEVIGAIRAVRATVVVVAASRELEGDTLRRLLWELEGSDVDVLMVSPLSDVAGPRLSIQEIGGVPLLHVAEPEFTGARRVLKSGIDRSVAFLLLTLLSPVLLLGALAVRLTSRGPAFFRQERVGVKGEPFTMVKFRSMYVDAEARLIDLKSRSDGDGLMFKMREDPRVTPVGRFLRKWSVDELPQLFNVLGGSMSLVGPRPPLPREVAQYDAEIHRRLLVRPGITGLWQVSGRSDLPWDEAVQLDLDYVQNWSIAMDLLILARTVVAVLGRRGAY